MKTCSFSRSVKAALAAMFAAAFALPVQAEDVKTALESDRSLSEFNALVERTGQAGLLDRGGYTVFAPVNGSLAEYPADRYPYLFTVAPTPESAEWAARIVRNHVVPGAVYFDNVTASKGGLFSVDGRFIAISEAPRGTFFVDGHRVLNTRMLSGGGMLYEIDGLIAKPWELTEIILQEAPLADNSGTTIVVPRGSNVTVDQTTYPDGSTTTTISPR